ncbi:Transmembrane 9 superfamily member 12 [Sesamum angolense]|uniref:Transmembrane 9 superfamily member n=1 Tax=Sesamum angolense TaxID=2727404 RepID=A0AAE1WG36_9LAMI|nr:Transmembrane 9 superfamily member 12 [Sesamum angolense]
MALPLISRRKLCTAFVCLVLVFQTTYGFYLPGSYMNTYSTGDEIYAKVNSLTSIETELPFSYYSLPYCTPQGGIKKSAENLGELLMGDQIDNSPYRFRMNINESLYICTTPPLSEYEVKLLKQRTRDLYQVNMILDNLPAMRAGVEIIGTGEEGMGVISEADKKKASGYEIVGFEVIPCSVKYDPEKMAKLHRYDNVTSVSCPLELDKSQIIREQERVSFTYEVEFVKATLGIVFVIFLRTVRRDLTRYEELDKEAQAQMNEELSGWKLVVASRGMLLTGMILLYLFLGIAAGYVGVRMWTTIKGSSEGWRSVSWSIACFFPGIVFVILTVLNFILWGSKSTGALPISLYFKLLALWFCISVPLTLLGGHFGTRAQPIQYPVCTNQIPREIPARKYPSWLLVLGAGTLPFGTLFIELFFILSSIWLGRFYYVFGFLLIVLLLLVIVCAEVSVVLTYMHLCVEDWMWWWKAFYASGSVALYVFLYSVNYLVFDLKSLSGPVSATLYLGYSLIMAIAIMLSTGTIGFLTSFYFVHYLFSSVKID